MQVLKSQNLLDLPRGVESGDVSMNSNMSGQSKTGRR
jgi:hypothetical protein